jgi:lipid-A-disaccharide synthase
MTRPRLENGLLAAIPSGRVDLLLVAGEHSGDEHGAALVRRLKERHPGLRIAALGGPALAAAGAELLHDLTASSVVGLVEVLRHYGYFRRLFRETAEWIEQRRPAAVVFIDYPGFNLRLAAELRTRGLSRKGGGTVATLFYISPQIWAWKAGRRFSMARDLDGLATIFPFEPACYADTSLPVEFVGHPFLEPEYRSPVGYDPSGPVLLLPGSRRQAVSRIFPVMRETLLRAGAGRAAVCLYPSDEIRAVIEGLGPPVGLDLRRVGPRIAASAVLTSSGTMSMHCALAGIPGVVVYRANPLTYLIGRQLVKVKYLGISNLLLGREMYPEFLQGAASPDRLCRELDLCLTDGGRIRQARQDAADLRQMLAASPERDAAAWVWMNSGLETVATQSGTGDVR